jgi:YfiH family protein
MNLVQPTGAFEWVQEPWGPALRCVPLSRIARHVFSTRHLQVPGARDEAGQSWADLAAAVGVKRADLVRLRQVHGAVVFESSIRTRPSASYEDWPEADVAISNDPSVALTVRAADCVPLLLADRATGAVAAVHAGWRGTAAGAAMAAVAALSQAFGTRPEDLVAAVGPSIGPCCYTVGEELVAKCSAHPEASQWFRGESRLILDLWRATRDQLLRAGLEPEHIHVSELCTASHAELFHSYRRDGKSTGRLAAVIRPG